ncbi:MAG TPA: tyrosine-type recombinase/integrase [bacterium]|nr:tyrosine-type recombinase/integrase [bacterium]
MKRQWKKAQVAAGIARPIRWQDLRHQCASLLIAAGKNPLYIAKQMGHKDPGFTLRQYWHLFETIKRTPVEWIDDLVWPTGCDVGVTWAAATTRQDAGGTGVRANAEDQANVGFGEMVFGDVRSVLAEGVGFEPTDPG